MKASFMALAASLLVVSAAQAKPFLQQDLMGSWCHHTTEYADGNQSNERASYVFGADQQVRMQDPSYETRSRYQLKGSRLKMGALGKYSVLQLTAKQLLLKQGNGSVMYLKRGQC